MKSITKSAMIAVAMGSVSLPISVSAADMAGIIPSDAVAAAWVDSLPETKSELEASPMGRAWQDQELSKLREFVDGKFAEISEDFSGETEVDMDALCDAAKGGVGAWIGWQEGNEDFYFMVAIETDEAGQSTFRTLTDSMREDMADEVERTTFSTGGTTVYTLSVVEDDDDSDFGMMAEDPDFETINYAFPEGWFVFAVDASESAIKTAINSIGEGGGNGISSTDGFRSAAQGEPLGDVFAFVNINSLTTTAFGEQGADFLQKMSVTGAMDFHSLLGSLDFEDNNVSSIARVSVASEKNGMLAALYSTDDAQLDGAAKVPGDSLGFASWMLDIGAVVDAAIKIIDTFQPGMGGIVGMQAGSIASQYGVNPLDGILKNIAGEHFMYQRELAPEAANQITDPVMREMTYSQAFVLSFKNGQQTSENLATLIDSLTKDPDMGGALEVSKEDNLTVVDINTPGAEESPIRYSFAFDQNRLIIANNNAEMREAIRYTSGNGAAPLAGDDGYREAAASVEREDLRVFNYTSAEASAQGLEALRMALESIPTDDEFGFTPDMLPSSDIWTKYFSSNTTAVTFGDQLIEIQSITHGAK